MILFLLFFSEAVLISCLCFFLRKEKELCQIEKRYAIKRRWKEDDFAFKSVQVRLFSKKIRMLLLELHRLSSESAFLLEMKKKYAGKFCYLIDFKSGYLHLDYYHYCDGKEMVLQKLVENKSQECCNNYSI